MKSDSEDWIRVRLREADGWYDGRLIARLQDCLVINVVGAERNFEGTHVFPIRAIESEEPVPFTLSLTVSNSMNRALRTRSIDGHSIQAILKSRPQDRLLLLEEIGDSEVCWIGFATVDGEEVVLNEVDPNGNASATTRYPIDGLSRVAWGGGYLTALEECIRPGSAAVDAFSATVRGLVDIVTAGAELGPLERILAELQMRVLDLPDWDSDGSEGEALRLPGPLPDLLYWDVFDPCAEVPEEPIANSLADDLSDIWRDTTQGLSLFDAGDRGGACSHWKLMHQAHWGEHLVGALRALHLADR